MTSNNRPNASPRGGSDPDHTGIPQYEIRVKGHLGHRWAASFEGLNLTAEDNGVTLISGPVVDQAALHGLLTKLRDLGIPLISLVQLPQREPSELSNLDQNPLSHNPSGATS